MSKKPTMRELQGQLDMWKANWNQSDKERCLALKRAELEKARADKAEKERDEANDRAASGNGDLYDLASRSWRLWSMISTTGRASLRRIV